MRMFDHNVPKNGELAYSTLWHRHFETKQHLDLYAVVVVVVVVVVVAVVVAVVATI